MNDALVPIDRFEVFAAGVDHPECIAFDSDGNLWAGGEAGQVYRIEGAGRAEQVTTLGSFNGGIACNAADELFVCNPAAGVVRVRRDGSHQLFASHAGDHKMICPNFGLFDSAGNYWVTDSGEWRKGNGHLLRFTPDGKGEVVAGPFGYANGLALSPDETTLYMAESDTNRVWRFDLRGGSHAVFADNVGRLPDGLAFDPHGNLCVSCYASDDIHRLARDGRTKQLLAHDPFAILISRPTNIVFRDGYVYVANLGRTTITRGKL